MKKIWFLAIIGTVVLVLTTNVVALVANEINVAPAQSVVDMEQIRDTLSENIVRHDKNKYYQMMETLETLDLSNETLTMCSLKLSI